MKYIKNLILLLVVTYSNIQGGSYVPVGGAQYLQSVTNNAGGSQDGYYFLTSTMALYEPTDKDNSIICKVNPTSYYTPSEISNKNIKPQNLQDFLPILKCALEGTTCAETSCNPSTGLVTQCNFFDAKKTYNFWIPGTGNKINFYDDSTYAKINSPLAGSAESIIGSTLGDPLVLGAQYGYANKLPKTLIAVPGKPGATDPIIMVSRDKAGKFYTAAFLLAKNIGAGATNDGVYFPVDASLDYHYIDLGTTPAALNLEIKPITQSFVVDEKGTKQDYTFNWAPVLTSGGKSTETKQSSKSYSSW